MTARHTPAGSKEHVTVRASQADIDVLSQVVADAFHDLAVSRWLIPGRASRRDAFPDYFRLYVEHAMADGIVETTPNRAGAALWIPSTGPAAPPDGYAARLAAIAGPQLGRFMSFDEALDRHHPAGIRHHHLALLAVHPDRQRLGIGTALLEAHHAWLDEQDMPAYLEASDTGTRDLYLRHGYELRPDSPIRLPAGPAMWPMWRTPRSAAGSPAREVPPPPG
jgi:GNAT superfamily N-acetyltransferase